MDGLLGFQGRLGNENGDDLLLDAVRGAGILFLGQFNIEDQLKIDLTVFATDDVAGLRVMDGRGFSNNLKYFAFLEFRLCKGQWARRPTYLVSQKDRSSLLASVTVNGLEAQVSEQGAQLRGVVGRQEILTIRGTQYRSSGFPRDF